MSNSAKSRYEFVYLVQRIVLEEELVINLENPNEISRSKDIIRDADFDE